MHIIDWQRVNKRKQLHKVLVYRSLSSYPDPPLTVLSSPETLDVLDHDNFNTFSITCTAELPSGVQASKVINWQRTLEGESPEPVVANGDTIVIVTTDLDSPTSTSVLTVTEVISGQYVYTCTATVVGLPGDPDITGSASTDATVRGLFLLCRYHPYTPYVAPI